MRTHVVLVALLLAGCSGPKEDTASEDHDHSEHVHEEHMWLRGTVVSPAVVPIAGANVTLVGINETQVTGADGGFDFGELAPRLYTLSATARGFEAGAITVGPEDVGASLYLTLLPGYPVTPYNRTVHFEGTLECAFEALIISPSCDSGPLALNDPIEEETGERPIPQAFDQNFSFLFQTELGWKTIVIDVVFDAADHPGLEGLRMVLRGSLDPDGGGEYQQYGRWHNPTSFTVPVEPGGNYTDGVEPVPLDVNGFQIDVYPHGHGYHEVCSEEDCFLGAGAAFQVDFNVYATVFYVDPAPDGFSFVP